MGSSLATVGDVADMICKAARKRAVNVATQTPERNEVFDMATQTPIDFKVFRDEYSGQVSFATHRPGSIGFF